MTLRFFFAVPSLFFILGSQANTITVSEDIGFDSENSTSFLQFAMNQAPDTVIIDNVGEPWITGPLLVNSGDLTIIIEPGTVLNALAGAYGEFDPMFRIRDVENVTVLGYGATIQMNKQEYIDLADSEYRHAFNLGSVVNVRIEGLEVKDTGGDGVLIGKSFQPGALVNFSEDVVIRNCVFDNNYRQGISVVSVKDCLIENCIMKNTIGALPEAGIDIEPDDPTERIEDLVIRNCQFINNNGNGIQVALTFMDDTSEDVSVLVEDCYFENNFTLSNIYAYAELSFNDNGGNGVDGAVNFSRCYVASSQWSAVYVKKTIESYDINFEDCVFKNVSQNPIDFNNPIFFEVTNYEESAPRTGGVSFTDCRIDFSADIPLLTYFENLGTVEGLGNVTGNFFVSPTTSQTIDIGTDPENVDITFSEIETTLPTVDFAGIGNPYLENAGVPVSYFIVRTDPSQSPLALDVTFGGTATNGTDYDLQPPFVLMPVGVSSIQREFAILDDDLVEGTETLSIAIQSSDCYESGAEDEIETTILDDNALSLDHNIRYKRYSLYPNPTSGTINFSLKNSDSLNRLTLFNLSGKRLKEFSINEGQFSIQDLPAGVYILQVSHAEGSEHHKIILAK